MLRTITGVKGPSGFGSAATADQVTNGLDGSGLTAIVTGGASGIGVETVRVLALRKVHVIIAARNTVAANEAKQGILKDNKAARIDVLKLDLNSLKSVKAFADSFKSLNLPLNILVNNAGMLFCPFKLSEDGIEQQFATNYLGHFYLTNLLLDKMKETAKTSGVQGRIILLSSDLHRYTYKEGIRFDKINDKNGYQDRAAYGQSKLATVLQAKELSRRLQEEGANITVNSLHPGVIMTNLVKDHALLAKTIKAFTFFIWKSIPQGAATTCYLALHPGVKGVTGKYFDDCNEAKPSKLAQDEASGRRLWDFSNNMVNAAIAT